MGTVARIKTDLRDYWSLRVFAGIGALAIMLGALRFEDPRAACVWAVAVGVPQAIALVSLKRRIKRDLANRAASPRV